MTANASPLSEPLTKYLRLLARRDEAADVLKRATKAVAVALEELRTVAEAEVPELAAAAMAAPPTKRQRRAE